MAGGVMLMHGRRKLRRLLRLLLKPGRRADLLPA
jgi:hypothetical protein